MLKVEHVTFRYERRGAPVLRDASLSLETGQVGVLLGRNGCGKTTLLKTTLGLCTPEQGQILFDGHALGAMKRQQRAQVAAYVPQEAAIRRAAGIRRGAGRAGEPLRHTARYGGPYGGGGRAGGHGPDGAGGTECADAVRRRGRRWPLPGRWPRSRSCWYSTVPTGNLDVANEQRILRQARRLARTRGMTVLCTLHDLNQAMAYGDRLFLMRDGQVRYAGNGDILTPETVWDIFGARVRAAEIDGQKILIGVNEDEY